jgi:hypothetical protein
MSDAYPKKFTADQEHYKRTVARIESIQSHLSNSPRGIRLKDKVCIITGVGSMKGIGYGWVYCHLVAALTVTKYEQTGFGTAICPPKCVCPTRKPVTYSLNNEIIPGARHLYLLDFSPENLPDLKFTIAKSYPDVKVSFWPGHW